MGSSSSVASLPRVFEDGHRSRFLCQMSVHGHQVMNYSVKIVFLKGPWNGTVFGGDSSYGLRGRSPGSGSRPNECARSPRMDYSVKTAFLKGP